MQRTLKINFPDDFVFPEHHENENLLKECGRCIFRAEDDCGNEYCVIGDDENGYKCPFCGKTENDIV